MADANMANFRIDEENTNKRIHDLEEGRSSTLSFEPVAESEYCTYNFTNASGCIKGNTVTLDVSMTATVIKKIGSVKWIENSVRFENLPLPAIVTVSSKNYAVHSVQNDDPGGESDCFSNIGIDTSSGKSTFRWYINSEMRSSYAVGTVFHFHSVFKYLVL